MSWSVLQSASNSFLAVTSDTVTFPSNASSGTKIICAIAQSGNHTIVSVKDAAGNNLTLLKTVVGGSSLVNLYLYAMDTPAGDVGSKPAITVIWNASSACSILIQEVSGLLAGNTTAMIDGTIGSTFAATTGSIGPPSYTSTTSGEYLVYLYGDNGGPLTWTVPAGYTGDANGINTNSSTDDIQIAYKNSTNGTETGAYSISGTATQWALIMCAFKLAPTGITLRGASTANTGASTALSSFTIANPSWNSGLSVENGGDTVVLYCALRGTSTFTTPAGFTAVTSFSSNSTVFQLFYKVTDGTGSSTFTVAYSAAGIAVAACASYTGSNDTVLILDPLPSGSGAAGTGTLPAASVTTTRNGDQLVWFGASKCALATDTPGTITAPSGFANQVTQSSTTAAATPNMTCMVSDMAQAVAGVTGTETGTTNNSTEHDAALLVAIAATVAASPVAPPGNVQFSPSHQKRYHHKPFGPVPRQAAASGSSSQQFTETLTAVIAVSDSQQTQVTRNNIAPLAIPGQQTRSVFHAAVMILAVILGVTRQMRYHLPGNIAVSAVIAAVGMRVAALITNVAVTVNQQRITGRMLIVPVAFIGAITRNITRSIIASLAVTAVNARSTFRNLIMMTAVTGVTAIQKFKQVILTAVTALGAVTVKNISRSSQVPVVITGMVTRNVTKTYITVITLSSAATRMVSRNLIAVVAHPGNMKNSIGKLLQSTVAAANVQARNVIKIFTAPAVTGSAVTRGITRNVTAGFAVIPLVTRQIRSSLAGTIAAAAAFTASRSSALIQVTLNTVIVFTGSATRNTIRILQTPVTVTPVIIRRINRILIASAAAGNVFTAIKTKFLTLISGVAVTEIITRKVTPNLAVPLIMVSGTIRGVTRTIQGTFAVAGQTARVINRVFTSPIVINATATISRFRAVILNAAAAVTSTMKRSIAVTESAAVTVTGKVIRGIRKTITSLTAVYGFMIAGRPHFLTLTTSISTVGVVLIRNSVSGFTLVFKYGIITGRWLSGQIKSRWKTGL